MSDLFEAPPEPDPFPEADRVPDAPPVKPRREAGPVAIAPQRLPVEVEASEVLNPIHEGEIIQLADPQDVARALDEARRFKAEILDPFINGLERVAERMAQTVGSGTIRAGEYEIVVSKSRRYVRDYRSMRAALVNAGLPEDRARDVFRETVEMKASTNDLNRLSKANPAYREAIDAHTTTIESEATAKVNRPQSAG